MRCNGNDTGLLLVGHGTTSDVGTRQFLALADRLAQRLAPLPVATAFLEMQEPDIDAAVGRLLEHSITRLVTMPLLLFAAGHAKHDIPRQVSAALARCGQSHIKQIQAAHLGCHPALVELSRLRMSHVDPTGVESLDDCLILVGRGSHDESATAEMHEFARLRAVGGATMKTEVAFLAMARPLLCDKIEQIARQGFGRVIVQPHLLFYGDLVESVERQVTEASARYPETEWLATPPLVDRKEIVMGTTELVQKVILDRCFEAGIHVVAPAGGD